MPYTINDGKLNVWLRIVPERDPAHLPPMDRVGREEALTLAVSKKNALRVEAQKVGDARAPFIPIAEIRFEEEIQIDQEALHFDPIAGRGFVPYGFLTDVRRRVYPVSVQSRPHTQTERLNREHEPVSRRLGRFFRLRPLALLDSGTVPNARLFWMRPWLPHSIRNIFRISSCWKAEWYLLAYPPLRFNPPPSTT